MVWQGISDVITAVETAINPAGPPALPVRFGIAQKALNVDAPAIWAFLVSEHYGPPQGPGGSFNARMLHTRFCDVEFHSWGIDVPQAEQIHFAIVTAIRQVMQGASYQLGAVKWIEPHNIERGAVAVMPVTFIMAVPQQTLPLAIPGAPATYQTAPVPLTEVVDTSAPNPAGTLYSGEP